MLCYLLCYMMNMVSCSKLSFVFLFVHKLLDSNSVLGSVLIAQVQIPCVMTFVSQQDGCVFCSAGNIFGCQNQGVGKERCRAEWNAWGIEVAARFSRFSFFFWKTLLYPLEILGIFQFEPWSLKIGNILS